VFGGGGFPHPPPPPPTALAGQTTAPGLALDVSSMDAVTAYDREARTCSVQPGAIQAELNARVEPNGLLFGADTSTSDVATLGGMIANNSAGMRSLVYGTTARQVRGLRCVLSDGEVVERARSRARRRSGARGEDAEARLLRCALELGDRHGDEIRRRYPHMVRRVSGWLDALVDPGTLDLTRLVCGSEGTLAVVTRTDLRLHPLPDQRRVGWFDRARRRRPTTSPRKPAGVRAALRAVGPAGHRLDRRSTTALGHLQQDQRAAGTRPGADCRSVLPSLARRRGRRP
jgi:FAD/FMN-containing dehydrogenase